MERLEASGLFDCFVIVERLTLVMPILHTRARPIGICMRGLLALARQRARQRTKQIQIQTSRCAGFRVMLLCFDIARTL